MDNKLKDDWEINDKPPFLVISLALIALYLAIIWGKLLLEHFF